MAIIKCKMCGGDIDLAVDKTFGTCEFCGSTMTFPKVDDEQRTAAFNRGNHFRRIGEFDKALAVYERIVREDNTDAEAHWCCALCRFGIEYVEDPATLEWLPTCHRASFDSFLEDVDYLAAVEYSEGVTRRQYQKDAAKIAEVQRGILATSQNEEPFDVFICYKESDENGERTRDSLMAQDVYYQLTEQGYRVFFSRITLEDMAGKQYEPYIFAALNSAKVMIVIGTKAEYMNAVWVKNEWSRFLSLMKKDRHKLLLPCYRDMDPYDMPEQLSVLQSYDMGKIGFIQDLIRGIKKVLDTDKKPEPVKETVVVQQTGNANTTALLKRGQMALEDGEWEKADGFFEEVLNQDAECVQAYLGKLMAELQVSKQETLKNEEEPFDDNSNYQKAMRFADERLRATLTGYIEHINTRNENTRRENLYQAAARVMTEANTEQTYKLAAQQFEELGAYKDSAVLAEECREKAEVRRKDLILHEAEIKMNGKSLDDFETALKFLSTIPDWKDAEEKIKECETIIANTKAKMEAELQERQRQIELARMEEEKNAKIRKVFACVFIAACVVVIVFSVIWANVIKPNRQYKDAIALMEEGKYAEASSIFEGLNGHKDSAGKIVACNAAVIDGKYNKAIALMEEGKYAEALSIFEGLDGHKDSAGKIVVCNAAIIDGKYNEAIALRDAGKEKEAAIAFGGAGDYSDAKEQAARLWDKVAVRQTIAAGHNHAVGLKADGTVVAVGDNVYGQCNVSGWTDIVAIAAGWYHTVGLKADGTVVAVGYNGNGQRNVSGWTDIVAIAAGDYDTVGLKADGTVVAVGKDGKSQCNGSDWTDIVAISTGEWHTAGLKADGTVVAVGYNEDGQCDVSGWTDIVAVSARFNHTVGLKADGTVVAVGDNDYGQCDVSGWTDIVAISAGWYHTVGLKADGTVVAVGDNDYGQRKVSGWTDIVAVSAGSEYTVGLKADGTVVAVGDNYDGQCDVSDWTNIKVPQK